jgi:hypothetical protein
MVPSMRDVARLADRQAVDGRAEAVEDDFADLGLGQVPQHHWAFKIDGLVKQVVADERP